MRTSAELRAGFRAYFESKGHTFRPSTPLIPLADDPELKLGEDEVAYRKWQEIGQPAERIVLLPAEHNFWSVGGPGPCGPDTEMFYDWGEEHGCGQPDCKPGCSRCERFLEFWN